MKVSIVIPARLESTRLPGKLLLPLGDRPVIQHVWERAIAAAAGSEVVVATDSDEIRKLIEGLGGLVRMTDPSCQSGTERIASILESLTGDFIVNIQASEPFVEDVLIQSLIQKAVETGCDLVTAVTPIQDPDDLFDPNIVKAVRASDGRAVYFGRNPNPYFRNEDRLHWPDAGTYFRHIGIYGYRKETLRWYREHPSCALERIECLEQLRFIDYGWKFQTIEVLHAPIRIDTAHDLERARENLNSNPSTAPPTPSIHYSNARETVFAEIESLVSILPKNRETIPAAVEMILAASGKVVVTGLGKSGIVARKLAATFSSTGTPSVYMNAAEALHGDLGMITPGDVVLMISKSGSTTELAQMVPTLANMGVGYIGLFGRTDTTLALGCAVVLDGSIRREACPLDLAPTTSTTVAVVIGDALAVALMKAREFVAEQFATFHPAGALGRRLLLRVRDVMYHGDSLPIVAPNDSVKSVLLEMTCKALGAACVCDGENRLIGIVTEGDIRRYFLRSNSFDETALAMMTASPVTVKSDESLSSLLEIMEGGSHPISVVPVVDALGHAVGIVRLHDILNFKGPT